MRKRDIQTMIDSILRELGGVEHNNAIESGALKWLSEKGRDDGFYANLLVKYAQSDSPTADEAKLGAQLRQFDKYLDVKGQHPENINWLHFETETKKFMPPSDSQAT